MTMSHTPPVVRLAENRYVGATRFPFSIRTVRGDLHKLLALLVPYLIGQRHRLSIYQDLTAPHGHLHSHIPVGGDSRLSVRIPHILRPQAPAQSLYLSIERAAVKLIAGNKEGD